MDCDAYRDDLLALLYGEGGDAAARRFEAHQGSCAECRREMAELRRLRGDLAAWRLPESLHRAPAAAPRLRRLPIGLAAAAALILALGASLRLGGAELRRDQAGFSLRVGRGPDARAMAEIEQRHRAEIAAVRAELAALRPPDERQLLTAVADMIRESEMRQEGARLDSVRSLREHAAAQRQYDLARMSAGLAYLDGKAGLQAARTTELVGHLFQASQQK
jgi:hypothetical protein